MINIDILESLILGYEWEGGECRAQWGIIEKGWNLKKKKRNKNVRL